MILETIFLWIGGLFCISLVVIGIMWLYIQFIDKAYFRTAVIGTKAIYYQLVSEWLRKKNPNNSNIHELELKLGTQWYTWFKNRKYTWKVVNVEDIKNE